MILFKRFRKCNNTNVHEDVTDFDQSNFDECIKNLIEMKELNEERIGAIIEHIKELSLNNVPFYIDFLKCYPAEVWCEYQINYWSGNTDFVVPYFLTYVKAINNFVFTPFDATDDENISIFYGEIFGARANKTCSNYQILNDILNSIILKTLLALQKNLPEFEIDEQYISNHATAYNFGNYFDAYIQKYW